MVRRIAFVAGSVALVIALVSVAIAVASRKDALVQHKVLTFALVDFQESDLDVGPSGRSPGDTFFFHNELTNLDGEGRLGSFESACVLENADTSMNRCTATAFLKDGNVEIATRVRFVESLEGVRYAVIGGTGKYKNVVGQARVGFGCDICAPGVEADTLTLNLIPSFQAP